MSYLITPSLYSEVAWYQFLEGKTKKDMLDTLNKVEIEPNEAMIKGRQFEDDIYDCTQGKPTPDGEYGRCVAEIADTVYGGNWQETVSSWITVNGIDFLLYGRTDVIKRDWIYDIKFGKNYDIGKYQYSIQHDLYMYCTGLQKFAYLISNGKEVWREDYFWYDSTEAYFRSALMDMTEFIFSDDEFRDAYIANWKTKTSREQDSGPKVGPPLTWNDLADEYDKGNQGRPAR